jgi:hypothetical protein
MEVLVCCEEREEKFSSKAFLMNEMLGKEKNTSKGTGVEN